MHAVPQCLACGTCCFSRLETYVRVSGDDHARLDEKADTLVRFESNRAYMRMIDGHCVALVVDAKTGNFACSAYEWRPQVCRDLARGSAECAGEIETKRERPLIALGMGRALMRAAVAPSVRAR